MVIEIFLGIITVLLLILLFLNLKKENFKQNDIELAVSNAWNKTGLQRSVGELGIIAQDIRKDYRSLDQMLRKPSERGSFGEFSLESILEDQLPQEMFKIRQQVFDNKTPDASIRSISGTICIDSKFPLDNYRKMIETSDPNEKENFQKQFKRDIQSHLNKIADDYIHPDKGSAEFAFAYIPSESIYYYLVTELPDVLIDYTKKGVQVTSPITLAHKIALIKAGVHAKKLSEEAEQLKKDLENLGTLFCLVDSRWQLVKKHFNNADKASANLDKTFEKLKTEFEKITSCTLNLEESYEE